MSLHSGCDDRAAWLHRQDQRQQVAPLGHGANHRALATIARAGTPSFPLPPAGCACDPPALAAVESSLRAAYERGTRVGMSGVRAAGSRPLAIRRRAELERCRTPACAGRVRAGAQGTQPCAGGGRWRARRSCSGARSRRHARPAHVARGLPGPRKRWLLQKRSTSACGRTLAAGRPRRWRS